MMFKSYTDSIKLTPWRIDCIRRLLTTDRQILALKPGRGKTALCYTIAKLQKLKTLVVSTKTAVEKEWMLQYIQWDEFKTLEVVNLRDGHADYFDIACINYDMLHNLNSLVDLSKIQMLVLDESGSVKHEKSKRARLIAKDFKKNYNVKIIMCDGVVTGERLYDTYSQLKLLGCHEKIAMSKTALTAKYPSLSNLSSIKNKEFTEVGSRINEEINNFCEEAHHHIFAIDEVKIEDYVEDIFYNVRLDKVAYTAINSMLHDYVLKIGDNTDNVESFIYAPNNLAVRQKILQICNGGIYKNTKIINRETGEIKEIVFKDQADRTHYISKTKIKFLKSLIATMSDRCVLIVYKYKIDKFQIESEFGSEYILEDADDDHAIELINKFRCGSINMLFINFHKHCKALNLHGACNDVIIYTQSEVYNVYRQILGRVWNRGDVLNKVKVHHLIAHTIEKNLFNMRKNKQDLDSHFNAVLANYVQRNNSI